MFTRQGAAKNSNFFIFIIEKSYQVSSETSIFQTIRRHGGKIVTIFFQSFLASCLGRYVEDENLIKPHPKKLVS
jgi:hypothetical protein